uniref:Heparan sulfate proteoglycan 2 n=1 Tax=Chelydra serpentina TaxID=8475 RepID=A0A8C3T351_CHESE
MGAEDFPSPGARLGLSPPPHPPVCGACPCGEGQGSAPSAHMGGGQFLREVYFRALVNFTKSIDYSPHLIDANSEEFQEVSEAVVDTLESEYYKIGGEQVVSVVFIKEIDGYTFVELDVGSEGNPDEGEIRKVLYSVIESGSIAAYVTSTQGFQFRRLGAVAQIGLACVEQDRTGPQRSGLALEPGPMGWELSPGVGALVARRWPRLALTPAPVAVPLDVRACTGEEFACSSGECIEKEFRCDRRPDCRDMSDELHCAGIGQGRGYWRGWVQPGPLSWALLGGRELRPQPWGSLRFTTQLQTETNQTNPPAGSSPPLGPLLSPLSILPAKGVTSQPPSWLILLSRAPSEWGGDHSGWFPSRTVETWRPLPSPPVLRPGSGSIPDGTRVGGSTLGLPDLQGECQLSPGISVARDCPTPCVQLFLLPSRCPIGYLGLSCERCDARFERVPEGPYLGTCSGCNCHGHSSSCDRVFGYCLNCQHNTEGPQCNKCKPGFFGDATRGNTTACRACPCPYTDSMRRFSDSCFLDTDGQATCDACAPGYTGRRCQRWVPGALGEQQGSQEFMKCDKRGSSDSTGGACRCKPNVVGHLCNECTSGAFYLSDQNPDGCLKCFCMGVSRQCASSSWNREQVTPADSRAHFSLANLANTRTVSEGIRSPSHAELAFSAFHALPRDVYYWVLPDRFKGDKVTSYGGELHYTVMYSAAHGAHPLPGQPDVLLRGNGIFLEHFAEADPLPGTPTRLTVPFRERAWRRADRQDATREHLLMALADIDLFMIRASYMDRPAESRLSNIRMDVAVPHATGLEQAVEVEECTCPPGYRGPSCQDCDVGYARTTSGLYLGTCERCDCSGHSTECDAETGDCQNCQDNTEGTRCERCQPGYYGDAQRGTPADCQPCPCHRPHATSQATKTCFLDTDGQPTCNDCTTGYVGRQCQRYGGCQSVPSREPSGNCSCDPQGSVSRQCDASRQCQCKPHVEGPSCSSCRANHFHLSAENRDGCLPCFCMGVTQQCTSSSYYRGLITTPFLPGDFQSFALVNRQHSTRIVTGFAVELSAEGPQLSFGRFGQLGQESYYWQLPEAYQGDKVWQEHGLHAFPTGGSTGSWQWGQSWGLHSTDTAPPGWVFVLDQLCPPSLKPQQVEGEDDSALTGRKGPNSLSVTGGICSFPGRQPCAGSARRVPGAPAECREHPPSAGSTNCVPGVPAVCRECLPCTGSPCPGLTGTFSTDCAACTQGIAGRRACGASVPQVQVSPAQTEVQEGSTVRLYCRVAGSPTATITWEKQGGSLPPQHTDIATLVIPSIAAADSGVYLCIGTSPAGVGTSAPPIQIESSSSAVTEGQSLDLNCLVPGQSPATVMWYKRGGSLPDGHQVSGSYLRLVRVSVTDSGEYVCRVSTGAAIQEASFIVTIHHATGSPHSSGVEPPVLIESSSSSIAEGETLDLNCLVAGQAPATVTWYKRGGSLPASHQVSGSRLRIPQVSAADSGEYICRVSNGAGPLEASVIVTIPLSAASGMAPPVRIESSSSSIAEGQTLDLNCLVVGQAPATVTWYKRGGSLPASHQVSDSRLRLVQVSAADSGEYVCRLSTSAGPREASITVSVPSGTSSSYRLQSPIISIEPHSTAVRQGEDATFKCRVHDGARPINITWKMAPKQQLQDNVKISPNGSVITISRARPSNQGAYRCVASNRYGVANSVVNLMVQGSPTVSVMPKGPVTVKAGKSISLDCLGMGDPRPLVRWSRLGMRQKIEHQTLLPLEPHPLPQISAAKPEDAGTYICMAQNSIGSAQVQVEVSVEAAHGKPGAPEITVKPTLTVIAGETATLQCSATGDPPPTIQWSKLRAPLPWQHQVVNNTLLIRRVAQQDSGQYICNASNAAGFTEAFITLDVETPPYATSLPEEVSVQAGEAVQLQCLAHGTPPLHYQWSKANGSLSSHAVLRASALHISPIAHEDSGTYRCRVSNRVGSAEAFAQVSVQAGTSVPLSPAGSAPGASPTVRVTPQMDVKGVGGTAEFTCSVTGDTRARIEWVREGGELPASHSVRNGVLRIQNLDRGCQGVYTCRVSSPSGQAQDSARLVIQALPKVMINVRTSVQSVLVGAAVEFECLAIGDPKARITWSKVGSHIRPEVVVSGGTVKIERVEQSDAGQYRCTATNDVGTVQSNVILHVQSIPQIATQPEVKEVTTGSRAVFPCLASGFPVPEIKWTKLEGDLPKDICLENNILTIPSVKPEDAGIYVCTASNRQGKVTAFSMLKVRERVVPYFTQNPPTFLALPTIKDAYKKFEIQITFRPESADGMLLYNGQKKSTGADFVSFGLVGGRPEFRFDAGSGMATIRHPAPIRLGEFHTIRLHRNLTRGSLVLDSHPPVNGTSQGKFQGLDLNEELYLGGYPDYTAVAKSGLSSGFVGCVRQLLVQGEEVIFKDLDLRAHSVSNCPTCRDRPCQNGGVCRDSESSSYVCHCPQEFTGSNCEHSQALHCHPGTAPQHRCPIATALSHGTRRGPAGQPWARPCTEWLLSSLDPISCVLYPALNGPSGAAQAPEPLAKPREAPGTEAEGACVPVTRRRLSPRQVSINGKKVDISYSFLESRGIAQCYDNSPCDRGPCLHGATCMATGEYAFQCRCQDGFRGDRCELAEDRCLLRNPCLNGGTCKANQCLCPAGFSGPYCEQGTRTGAGGRGAPGDRAGVSPAVGANTSRSPHRYQLGSGEASIVSEDPINDGEWHRVTAIREGRQGSIQVDGEELVSGESPGSNVMVNTQGSVYIGGAPAIRALTAGKFRSGITGCIKNLVLSSERPGPLPRQPIDLQHHSEAGVNMQECPS